MNLTSRTMVYGVTFFMTVFFAAELGARGRGGGGGGFAGAGGGGGFSRAGVASRGGFSTRPSQPARQPVQRPSPGTVTAADRQPVAANRQAGTSTARDEARGSQDDRQDWADASREDRQDAIMDRQDDRQDFIEDERDDYYDRWDDNDGEFIAGAIVGGAIVGTAAAASSTYVTTLPCTTTAVIVNGTSYYNCSSAWYQRSYAGSQVTYVVVNAPPGY